MDVAAEPDQSNDIAIGVGGGIGGGEALLVSSNATQLLIGDGLSGSGYALDNAEFGRLTATNINVVGRSDASAAIDTLVGTLGLTGRAGASRVAIATRTGTASRREPCASPGQSPGPGSARNDALNLAAGRVEVDATTGGISLSVDGALGGVLGIFAQRVHVAEASILDQLAVNTNYAARDADLARAPATQRPGGVIRAGEIGVQLVSAGAAQRG